MHILQILSEVLVSAAEAEKIPNVRFKMNNDLGEEVVKLSGAASTQAADESEADTINRYLAELSGAIDEETGQPKSIEDVEFSNEVCEKIADAVSNKMKSATDRLRSIHQEVTSISDRIKDRYNKSILADPFLAAHANEEEASFDFPSMRYDVLESLGGIKNTIAYVLSEADTDASAMTVQSKFINTIGKFTARKLSDDVLSTVAISADKRKEAVQKVNEENKDLLSDNINTISLVIINAQSLKALRNRIVKSVEKDTPTEVTISCLSLISDYRITAKKLAVAMSDLGVEVPDSNLQFINDLTDMCGVAAQWHRINTFQNTVLFRNKSLNPDMVKSMEDKGLSMKDLAQHVKYRYRDYELPGTGVTLESLEQSKEKITADVAKYSSQSKVRVEAGLHDAKQSAFIQVMSEYLTQPEFKDKVVGENNLRSYLVSCANKVTNEGATCEDVIYLIMEKLLYRGDFVMTLRENLGMDYVKAVASNKELTANEMAEINAVVYARLITNWLKSHFMEEVEEDITNESLTPSTEASTDTIDDPVFGKMIKTEYQYEKMETVTIFGKKVNVKIHTHSHTIDDKCRESYKYFKANIGKLSKDLKAALTKQAKDFADEVKEYTFSQKDVDNVEIKSVYFVESSDYNFIMKKDEALGFAILGECKWDYEHGWSIGVSVDKNGKAIWQAGQHSDYF